MDRIVLIVDDEATFSGAAKSFLAQTGRRVLTAPDVATGRALSERERVDVVVLDQRLPDGAGMELIENILEHNEHAKVIVSTAYPSFDNALAAIRHGVFDYLTKPVDLSDLERAVARALRTVELEKIENVVRYDASRHERSVRLASASMRRETTELIRRAAATEAPVLITGETGAGKNVAAKSIHFESPRRRGPFIDLNCAALPDSLIEAELFGHERGAFTGADAGRPGVFELADGGTLVLDEIGTMARTAQSKLLGVLEEKACRRVGGTRARPTDARIIAITNENIEAAVGDGSFREDLFFRLNVLRIHVPPLRDRPDDIPALCVRLLETIAPHRQVEIPDDEMARLCAYPWPGNVRELRNVLERCLALQSSPILWPSAVIGSSAPAAADVSVVPLREVERRSIENALASLQGNLTRTAKALGISLNTLKRRMRSFGLR